MMIVFIILFFSLLLFLVNEVVPAVKFDHHFALIPIIANLEANDSPHLVNGSE